MRDPPAKALKNVAAKHRGMDTIYQRAFTNAAQDVLSQVFWQRRLAKIEKNHLTYITKTTILVIISKTTSLVTYSIPASPAWEKSLMSQEQLLPKNATANSSSPPRGALDNDQTLAQIREALRGLEYGVLSIIVQDGVVVQIERTERKRLRRHP